MFIKHGQEQTILEKVKTILEKVILVFGLLNRNHRYILDSHCQLHLTDKDVQLDSRKIQTCTHP